ncbi:MAG: autotransporter outer membrane beta-barrel domain-containing protein [Alphaproteobacteria bacterium]|nr:autotransporter outer membrane beta-barrel domain-containing protein [Alphaproteobacteria bacterium]
MRKTKLVYGALGYLLISPAHCNTVINQDENGANATIPPIITIIPIISELQQLPEQRATPDEPFRLHQRGTFVPTQKQRKHTYMDTFSYANVNQPYESNVQRLSQAGPMVVNGQEHRLWAAPYYVQGKSDVVNSRSATDYSEGIAFGCEKRSSKNQWSLGLMASAGLGQFYVPVANVPKMSTTTNTGSLGLYHSKSFFDDGRLRYDAVLNGALNSHEVKRFGNPSAGALFRATGKYRSKSILFDFMTSWKFVPLPNFSIRPNLGITVDSRVFNAYTEQGGGNFNQSYRRKVIRSREPYAGLGFRQKWTKDSYDYKLTGVYEYGHDFGDNNTITQLNVVSAPSTLFSFNTQGAGRDAHYFTFYGSAFNAQKNFKVLLAYMATLKKHRTSHALTLKVEWRFGEKKK